MTKQRFFAQPRADPAITKPGRSTAPTPAAPHRSALLPPLGMLALPRAGRRLLSGSALRTPIPSATYDAVVVGGGVVGSSVAYNLQKQGLSTLLLEAHALTAGTTWHTAGMLWRLRPSYVDIELHTRTRQLAIELQEDDSAWTENGGLFIACNKERLAEYERLAQTGVKYGIESSVLSPSEAKDVHPLLNVDDIYGALYSPSDGTLDPEGLTKAYAKAAKALGATVIEGVRVAGVQIEQFTAIDGAAATRVLGIDTECGQQVRATHVINACGGWAGGLSASVGAPLPLLAMKHAYVVTESLQEHGMHGGLPNVRDHDLSIYLKAQGTALAIGGYERNPEFWESPQPDFAFGLFDLDWDTFLQNMEGHLQRCPPIETVGIASTVCGPEAFTPDHKPLVGPQPGVRGFWQACGFNSMGMMLSGGMGEQLAHWVSTGAPAIDMFSYDPARFHADTASDAAWVKQRTHESYAKTYAIVFPSDEALAGRGMRRSALYESLARRGCVYQARHGFERPGWFAGPSVGTDALPKHPYDYYGAYSESGSGWRLGEGHADVPQHKDHLYNDLIDGELTFDWPQSFSAVAAECHAAREGCALFDTSYFGKLLLDGPRADEAMQWMCSADLEGKPVGAVTYTPLCNGNGGVEADLTVTKVGENEWYLVTGGATKSRDVRWMHEALEAGGFGGKTGGVTLTDLSDAVTLLSVQGPYSHALLKPLVGSGAIDDLDTFAFSTARDVTFAGIDGVRCLRLTFMGELGFELHLPAHSAAAAYETLRSAATELSAATGAPIRDAGYFAIDSLSAEKSYRHWHADLGVADTPMEAGIGFTTLPKLKRPDKVRFLGSEALHAKQAAGLQRRLVTLVLDQDGGPGGYAPPLHGGEAILRDGKCLGIVRSTAYGHTLGRTIVTGYVECPEDLPKITPKWLREGSWAVSSKLTSTLSASLHLKPPFDPEGKRIRGEYHEDEPLEAHS